MIKFNSRSLNIIKGTLTLYIWPFLSPLNVAWKIGSQCTLHAVLVYLPLYLKMSTWDWTIQYAFYCQVWVFTLFPHLILILLGALSEPHHRGLIFRSSCLWRRGRGSIRVSRKSLLANLQLLQIPRHPTVMMRYDAPEYFLSKTSLFSCGHTRMLKIEFKHVRVLLMLSGTLKFTRNAFPLKQ